MHGGSLVGNKEEREREKGEWVTGREEQTRNVGGGWGEGKESSFRDSDKKGKAVL